MLLHLLLVYQGVNQEALASRIDTTSDESLWSSTNSSGRQHTSALGNHKHLAVAEAHRASLVQGDTATTALAAYEKTVAKRHAVQSANRSADGPQTATSAIIVLVVVGVCGSVAYKCLQPQSVRQDMTNRSSGKDSRSPRRSYSGEIQDKSVSQNTPSSSAERYKDKDAAKHKDRAGGAPESSSSDEDVDGRPPALAKPVVSDSQKIRVQEIEQAAKCLAVTCKKMPVHPTGLLGGAGGAKERFIATKAMEYERGSSWCTILKAWKKGKLGYWVDEKAFKAGQDPKGTIPLMDVTKVTIPDKHMEQVIVKYKEGLQDGYLTLQFKDHSSATAWRDSFKELRSRI